MQNNPLFKFDPGIDRTFHKLKRKRALLTKSSMARGEEAQRRILRDYVTPGAHSQTSDITIPLVAANTFELKQVLISMVQQSQCGGSPMENPNLHISVL